MTNSTFCRLMWGYFWIVALAMVQPVCAQTNLRIFPSPAGTPGGASVGAATFYDKNAGNYVALSAPDTLSSNLTFRLPGADGSAGYCMTTDGSKNLSFNACGLSLPATLNASSSGYLISSTNSGTGGVMNLSSSGSGETLFVTNSGGGPAIVASAGTGTAAAFSTNTSSFVVEGNGFLQAAEIQSSVTGTAIAFANLLSSFTVNGNGLLATSGGITDSGTTTLNGSVSGTHGQNFGTGDSPLVAGLTVNGSASGYLINSTNSGSGGVLNLSSSGTGQTLFVTNSGGGPAIVASAGTGGAAAFSTNTSSFVVEGNGFLQAAEIQSSVTGTALAFSNLFGSFLVNGNGLITSSGGLSLTGSSTLSMPATSIDASGNIGSNGYMALNGTGTYVWNGNVGLTYTLTLPCSGTILFAGGIFYNHTGTC